MFAAACPEDQLEGRWQRLVLTHLAEKEHLGVLTGSPITDMKVTLVAGRAHVKHTEGGDFRQATYRAVRQGLMEAESILLEPWYDFRLELPGPQVGRAMTDLQQMGARLNPPETVGEESVLTGSVAVSALGDYAREVAAYTQGRGRLLCTLRGYEPCPDQTRCWRASTTTHGGSGQLPGLRVLQPWGWCHRPLGRGARPGPRVQRPFPWAKGGCGGRRSGHPALLAYAGTIEQDKELQAIFERTYGPVKRRAFLRPRSPGGLLRRRRRSRRSGPSGSSSPAGVPAGGRLQHHLRLG